MNSFVLLFSLKCLEIKMTKWEAVVNFLYSLVGIYREVEQIKKDK